MARDRLRFTRLGVIVLAALLALAGGMIPVQAAPPATTVGPFVWNVAFYNNANLSGAAVLTRQDTYVGGNWGTGSPGPGVNADNFSARWSTNAYLTGGTYRLTFVADDAVRLYIDNQLLLNTFDAPQPGATLSVTVSAGTGSHLVQIDYREFTNTAYLYFTWEQLTFTPSAPTPVPAPAGPPVGTVNTAGLNVLSGPDYNFSLIEVAFQGWQVTLIARNGPGTWLKVQTPTTKIGWVEVSHITTSYPIASLPIGDRTQAGGTPPAYGPPPYTPPTTYPPGTRTYVVQPGDNLFRISLRFGVDMYTLARVNGIINLNLIYVGQVLVIP
jgi:nucleoid-associated protein YgaU